MSHIDPGVVWGGLVKWYQARAETELRYKGTGQHADALARFRRELGGVAERGWRAAAPGLFSAPAAPLEECAPAVGRGEVEFLDGAMRFAEGEELHVVQVPTAATPEEGPVMPEARVAQARVAWFVGACVAASLPPTRIWDMPIFMAMDPRGFGWCESPRAGDAGYALRADALVEGLMQVGHLPVDEARSIADLYAAAIVADGVGDVDGIGDAAGGPASAALRAALARAGVVADIVPIAAWARNEIKADRSYREAYSGPPSGRLADLAAFYFETIGSAEPIFDLCILSVAAILHVRSVGVVVRVDAADNMGWRRIQALEQVRGQPIAFSTCCAVSVASGSAALVPHYGVLPCLWDWKHCIFAADPPPEGTAPDHAYQMRREYATAIYLLRAIARRADHERSARFESKFCAVGGMAPISPETLDSGELWQTPSPPTEIAAFERIADSFARGLEAVGYKHVEDVELQDMKARGGLGRFVDLRAWEGHAGGDE